MKTRIDLDVDDIRIIAEKHEADYFDFVCKERHHDGFVYFIQGDGTLTFLENEQVVPVQDGTLFWFRAGDRYRFRVKAGCRYVTSSYHVTKDTFGMDTAPRVCQISGKTAVAITGLAREWGSRRPSSYLRCRLGILSLYADWMVDVAKPKLDPVTQAATEFILKNFRRPFSISELSALCSLSPSHLRRKFRSATGMTVTEYRDALRIETAREMLTSGLFTPKETAYELGYSDVYHFTKVFTAQVGVPPSRYARESV